MRPAPLPDDKTLIAYFMDEDLVVTWNEDTDAAPDTLRTLVTAVARDHDCTATFLRGGTFFARYRLTPTATS
jgi:hypothetical protein